MSDQNEGDQPFEELTSKAKSFETKAILVTGGTGLVGSHVIAQLVAKGRKVKALYRSKIPVSLQKENIQWTKGDILDVVALNEAMEGVDQVYHCAAMLSFNASHQKELFQVNIDGTANIVNECLLAGVKKLCFVSSVSALGTNNKGVEINEETAWSEENNSSNYGKSKYLAEVEVWRGIAEGLQAVIVNPAIILGAGDWNQGSTKMFKTAYEEFPWYSQGVTGFVDVRDVARAMIQLMNSNVSGERFIVSAENKQYKDVFTMAAEAFGKKPPYKKASSFLAEVILRVEAIKSLLTRHQSLLTRETADAAQSIVTFNNNKLTNYLPAFTYTPLPETIKRVCSELKQKNNLQ
ncbi:MAG: NAD-dependent epimerase/dehydratase family protein [Bacteroidota bacterium]|nr:NAD-dependent epimerase/dehydratase family protein [Bacteroidota bacterium]